MPGFAIGGKILRDGANLMVRGVKPVGLAKAGTVIWKRQPQPLWVVTSRGSPTYQPGAYTHRGTSFLVGVSSITITAIGREILPPWTAGGNDYPPEADRMFRIILTGTINVLAQVLIPKPSLPNEILWVPLPTPIALAANTRYTLAYTENNGSTVYYATGVQATPEPVISNMRFGAVSGDASGPTGVDNPFNAGMYGSMHLMYR